MLELAWPGTLELRVTVALGEGPCVESTQGASPVAAPGAMRRLGPIWLDDARIHVPARHRVALSRIADGALRYVTGCTLLRVAPGEACLLTDHRLLPLSWTRDAYYEALLLLAAGGPEHLGIVADHLRWLFGLQCNFERDHVLPRMRRSYTLDELAALGRTMDQVHTLPTAESVVETGMDPANDRGRRRTIAQA